MKLFAVTGKPILHSLSPVMHNAAFASLGLNACYMRLAADSANDALQVAKEIGISGLNITAPFKEEFVPLVDTLDEPSKILQAINTITISTDGTIHGYNTDIYGALGALLQADIAPKNAEVLILGAGGAAKAAAYGLVTAGARVTIANRTFERAKLLADFLGCNAIKLDELSLYNAMQRCSIIISTLSSKDLSLDFKSISPSHLFINANYNSNPNFECSITQTGARYIDGKSWLLHQGTKAFEIFTGSHAPFEVMQRALLDAKALPQSISLIGLMGVGKTSVCSFLAPLLGFNGIDIDRLIEDENKASIAEIFKTKGEPFFRDLESATLKKISSYSNVVVSSGGGLILEENNRRLLKELSTAIWLWSKPSVLAKRLENDLSRPLLGDDSLNSKLTMLLEERGPLYAATSDLILSSSEITPLNCAERIFYEYRETR